MVDALEYIKMVDGITTRYLDLHREVGAVLTISQW
jgi:hypothetical protein